MKDPCWIYQTGKPYPKLKANGKVTRISRLMWTSLNGEIPKDKEICHSCDNGACINPAHLYLASHKQNQQDMSKRGRARGIFQKGLKPWNTGSGKWNGSIENQKLGPRVRYDKDG